MGGGRAAALLVGLTGRIGSGKSEVGRLLAAQGARVVDSDEIVSQLLSTDQSVLAALRERFGPSVFRDGVLDRRALASVVFQDADARRALEGIVHPKVLAEILRIVEEEGQAGGLLVFEVPLLYEAGFHRFVDVVVAVEAPVQVRLRRLVESRGMDPADAERRIRVQEAKPPPWRVHASPPVFVLLNDGDLADLERRVRDLAARLERMAREKVLDGRVGG